MAIINILCLVMIALAAGYLLGVTLSDMLPFVWCGLIFTLYMLAFTRHLSFINFIEPIVAIALMAIAIVRAKKKGEGLLSIFGRELLSGPFLIYVLLSVIVCIGVSEKVVTWWDDINFWASDAKSLYYMDGFASKYANVSPEFGDYPPAVTLVKWFFLHFDPKQYREGLAFAGYYLFNLSFLMPLYKKVKGINLLYIVPLAIVSWFFAGMADKYGYAGFCADLTMAYLFGSILISAVDRQEKRELFEFIRVGLYLAVLVICKSTGPFWALFGLIIYIGTGIFNVTDVTLKKIFKTSSVIVFPLVTGISWAGFCLLMHRVTKTTTTAITYITTDKYGLSEYTSQFASAFIKAFFIEPLHADRTWIDLSPAMMIVLLSFLLAFMIKRNFEGKRFGRFMYISLPIMGIIYYIVIFIAHITIFATETQYLESGAMIASIERYGVPYMLGCMMLISYLWIGRENGNDGRCRILIYIVAVMLLTNVPAAIDGLVGYRHHLADDVKIRQDFVDDESGVFLNTIREKLPNGNTRVCRLHDGGYYRVADTYVAYEASPVSVMNISYDLSAIDEGTLIQAIAATHAKFLYADMQETEESYASEMTENGLFEYRTLYYISYEGGGMKLYKQ